MPGSWKLVASMLWDSITKDPENRTPLERAWDASTEAVDAIELYNTVLSWSDTPAQRRQFESA